MKDSWQARLRQANRDGSVGREFAVGRASAALATLIAQRLADKGMTQDQLAAALGITAGAVSRKLNEASDMRLSSAAAILWALDVPLYREFERLCEEGWGAEAMTTAVLPLHWPKRRQSVIRAESQIEIGASTGDWSAVG